MTASGPSVVLSGVTKTYQSGAVRVQALKGVNAQIGAAEFVAFCGPSGSGKSTLLNIIGCLDYPSEGTVHVLGQDVAAMDDTALSDLRNRHMGFVFQSYNLLPTLSAFENVEYPLYLQGVGAVERENRVKEVLQMVGLGDKAKQRPAELSGGQQQRVAIARAIVTRPQLILADEPTASLDSETGFRIVELLQSMRAEIGCTLLMATHDLRLLTFADRVLRILDGKLGLVLEETENVASLS
jgi:putative ABC transport system ATP-binding protein